MNNIDPNRIRISKRTYQRIVVERVVKSIVYSLLAVVILYLCFAATILRIIPTSNMGGVLVKNSTFPGGIAPKGSIVLINNTQPQGENILNRLQQSVVLTKNASKVKIIAGPYGDIVWAKPGIMSVDGKLLKYRVPVSPTGNYLKNQYVGVCLEGSCVKGKAFIFSAKNIYGTPLKQEGE